MSTNNVIVSFVFDVRKTYLSNKPNFPLIGIPVNRLFIFIEGSLYVGFFVVPLNKRVKVWLSVVLSPDPSILVTGQAADFTVLSYKNLFLTTLSITLALILLFQQ